MDPYKSNGANALSVEREAEIPQLISRQRTHLEELQVLLERLASKLECVMTPIPVSKTVADASTPVCTSIGNLLDSANQQLAASNYRVREMLDRLAL